MGFLGGIFGRDRVRAPRPGRFEDLAGAVDRLGLRAGDRAGILFNPEEGASTAGLLEDLRGALRGGSSSKRTGLDVVADEFETAWIVLENPNFEELVGSIHALNEALFERGNGSRLLAAVVGMDFERKAAYWVYNYKRGHFHPLVPLDRQRGGERDNEAEYRLGELMHKGRVAVEYNLEHWYGLAGIPF